MKRCIMRRRDREMSEAFGLGIIDKSRYGVLSMVDRDGKPFGLPLSIARDGHCMYFHSAQSGRKVEILQENPEVSVAFVGDVNVPELYTEEELEMLARSEQAAALISKVFTTQYESAVVTGVVKRVDDESEKIKALRLICEKYASDKMKYFHIAAQSGLSKTEVYRIEIKEVRAKRKRYDQFGEEMKWGRT